MAEPIYVRYEGRYWRLSVLLRRYGITASAGYRRHKAYGRPKVYKKWMLAPMNSTVALPVAVTIDGVPYKSIKEATQALGLAKHRLGRRIKKLGTVLTSEQIKVDDPRGDLANLKRKPTKPADEWKSLSNKKNTGRARRPSEEWLAFTDRPRESHTPY